MLTLRHYQEEAVTSIFQYFSSNFGNPLVALPTGTGKALVQAEFIRRALYYYPTTRILGLTHVKELIGQNHAELLTIWPQAPAGIFSAGLKRKDTHLPVTFAGIQSIHKSLDWFGRIDLVLVDEAHLMSDKGATMYAKTIAELKTRNPFLKVVGLTATPFRTGTGLLTDGQLFTDICCDYTSLDRFNQLVDEGYIAPLVPKRTDTELDVSEVGVHGGEFNMDELQAAVDKTSITKAALLEAYHHARYRRSWLVFCAGTKHCDHVVEELNRMGVSARAVHSALPGGDIERDRNLADFKAEKFQALVGMNVFTTGFNHKPVDTIVMLRPTKSTSLWVQMLGRGTRPCPETGKTTCLVLDFAANTRRLGPINDPVIPRKKGKKGGGFVPYKTCPVCNTYNHTRARFCISCQFEFPEHFAGETKADTAELIRKEKPVEPPAPPKPKPETVIQEWQVQRVEYAPHHSKDTSKPPSLRVTYHCGPRLFNEWLCFEHTGYPLRKAKEAWRLMGGEDTPLTVDEALSEVDMLQPPSFIRVAHGGKFPEIVGYEFGRDGAPIPEVIATDELGERLNGDDPGTYKASPLAAPVPNGVGDDDIPF